MQNHNENFSMQDALRLASTPAGQQLLQLLKSSGGDSIDQARKHAASGDYQQAKNSLSDILKSPKVQQLLREMENSHE